MILRSHALLIGAMLVTVSLVAAPALAQDTAEAPEGVVAIVDGVEITQELYDIAAADLAQVLSRMPAQMHRDYVITYLTDLELLRASDVAAQAVEEPNVRIALDYARGKALIDVVLSRVGDGAINEEAIQTLFDEVIAENPPQDEVSARHILVETEEEATALRAEIEEGADFAELAAEHSLDPGSGPNGGDLGFFTQDMMVPPFAETAFALDPGSVSDPVQTQFGWHIILVEDRRRTEPPTLDEVRSQIIDTIARTAARDYLVELRENADIETFSPEPEEGVDESEAAPQE
ncbi:MAG: peptidylprolyl isomerase [Pseudomonadota bacterium]